MIKGGEIFREKDETRKLILCLSLFVLPQCECDGPISTQVYDATPLFTIQEAIAAAPEGCVLKVPSALDLQLVPPGVGDGIIVPVVADFATVGACLAPPCTDGFFYLDGTPVPATDFAGGEPVPGDSTAFMPLAPPLGPTGEPLIVGATAAEIRGGAGLIAYYSCCLASEETCTEFTAPATMVPTPSPTKGKSPRRLL